MKEKTQAINDSEVSSFKMLRAMVGIGLFCALMIVVTFQGTLQRIEKLKAEALEKAVFKVVPGMVSKRTFQLGPDNVLVEVDKPDKDAEVVYGGYDADGKLMGIALGASGMGFADILRILYGYDPEKEAIVGYYVLETKETPGLGDKIEKDKKFLANFEALDVKLNEEKTALVNTIVPVKSGTKENPWEVDCITGATISSRAIGNIMDASTQKWVPLLNKNKDLFTSGNQEKAQ
jgi:electron transport complex protein RnfG